MAAGLGFKTFTTGEVLTAADTNGYLMQGVLVFASAAARDAAITSPQEGQCCYLKDTDAVLTYSGSAWVGFDDSNAIQNAIVDAKGDLIAASAADTPARLAVGNNGETLVADSSTSTGLRWQGNYAAGKNFLINGNMNIAQRGTSAAGLTTGSFATVDRFQFDIGTLGTWTMTQETDAPAGFGSSAKMLCTTADAAPAAADYLSIFQPLEGQALQSIQKGTATAQPLTLSFWVKSNVTGTYIAELRDADNTRTVSASYTVSASGTWEKKSVTFPADTTGAFTNDNGLSLQVRWWLGVGSNFSSGTLATTWQSQTNANRAVGQTNLGSAINNYLQITGCQLEIGSIATAFSLSAGTLQGELAACQRYYFRSVSTSSYGWFGSGMAASTTSTSIGVPLPSTMRVVPTSVDFSTLSLVDSVTATAVTSCTIDSNVSSNQFGVVTAGVASGLTQYRPYYLRQNANNAGYIGFSAEL